MYTTMQWEWDEAKFQLKTPLRDLCETISQRISSLDEELKLKVAELNILKASVQGLERKTQGNLMVRGLGDIVREENVMESDYMTTMYVVVPKASTKDFQDSYEKMATYVVPKSGRLLSEDQEYALFAVVIFKKSHDEFKAQCREKRFTLREFTYDPSTLEADRIKKETDSADYERLKSMLANWCHINYAEVYTMMVHMKAVRARPPAPHPPRHLARSRATALPPRPRPFPAAAPPPPSHPSPLTRPHNVPRRASRGGARLSRGPSASASPVPPYHDARACRLPLGLHRCVCLSSRCCDSA